MVFIATIPTYNLFTPLPPVSELFLCLGFPFTLYVVLCVRYLDVTCAGVQKTIHKVCGDQNILVSMRTSLICLLTWLFIHLFVYLLRVRL
jgi:hypothetical protein